MNIYYNTSFEGHYPVGTAALVRANNPKEAAKLLNRELEKQGLPASARPELMYLFSDESPAVVILNDGNY